MANASALANVGTGEPELLWSCWVENPIDVTVDHLTVLAHDQLDEVRLAGVGGVVAAGTFGVITAFMTPWDGRVIPLAV